MTSETLSLLNYAKKCFGRSNAWTSQTKVFVKPDINSKRKCVVTRKEHIDELYQNSRSPPHPQNSSLSLRSCSVPTNDNASNNLVQNSLVVGHTPTWPNVKEAAMYNKMSKRQQENFLNESAKGSTPTLHLNS